MLVLYDDFSMSVSSTVKSKIWVEKRTCIALFRVQPSSLVYVQIIYKSRSQKRREIIRVWTLHVENLDEVSNFPSGIDVTE